MRAMVLDAPRRPLRLEERGEPRNPGPREVLIRIHACGVCRTDLHVVDGELPDPKLPLVPGHEIVGTVAEAGREGERLEPGDRGGVPWLGRTDGTCPSCRRRPPNLRDPPRLTGHTLHGRPRAP